MLPDKLKKKIDKQAKKLPIHLRPQFYAEVRKNIERELLAADSRQSAKALAVEHRKAS